MPDHSGNNRLDSLRNLLSGSGEMGMIFFIPGIDDALRLNRPSLGQMVRDPTGMGEAETTEEALVKFREQL